VNEILRFRDELEWRLVEGEVLALDVAEQRYLSVNRSGAVLWCALAEGATREELVGRLVDTFDVHPDAAAREIDAFVGALSRERLIAGG
jgi:coenzyme PQQ synthesis protein D (PqqD)